MSVKFESLAIVGVDYNVHPVVENDVEVHRADCPEFWAVTSPLKAGDLVLASADEEGFLARVVEPPVARGKRLDPFTGAAKQAYRVLVTPVDISTLMVTK